MTVAGVKFPKKNIPLKPTWEFLKSADTSEDETTREPSKGRREGTAERLKMGQTTDRFIKIKQPMPGSTVSKSYNRAIEKINNRDRPRQ